MKRVMFFWGILIALFGISAPGFAGWTSNLIGPANNGGSGLPYHIYVPDTQASAGSGRALMISLHGCVMSHSIMRDRANWQSIADEKGMIVVVVDENNEHYNGCFQWWDEAPADRDGASQSSRIIQITELIKNDPQYNIDPNQVYISGVSAGAGMSWQIACLAPDIFAGVGLVASPMLRVGSKGGFGYIPKEPNYVKDKCDELAGSNAGSFDTFVFSLLQGANDSVVDKRYLQDNTEGVVEGIMSIHGMPGKTYSNPDNLEGVISYDYASSTMKVWKQGETVRVSYIQIAGMDHRWPSGDGVAAYGGVFNGNYYVDGNFGNYTKYLTNFLFKNNMRIDSQPGINVTISSPSEGTCINRGQSVSVNTSINSDNGVKHVVFSVNDNPKYTDSSSPYAFAWNTTGLVEGNYTLKALGTDRSEPALTDEATVTVTVKDQCASSSEQVFEHSKEVIMPEDLFNITGRYGVAMAGGTFLHGSGTDKRTFPRETIVSTSDSLDIPEGATIKYAFLYYGGLIGIKDNYRECDTCPLQSLPTVNKWDSNYKFMGDYTPDGLDNEGDVRNNKITFTINGQNYGPYGPETASQPSPQPIGNVSKIDWEHLAKIMQGTLQGTAFTLWSNRIDITGLLVGKTGTVNLTVNPPDELDVSVNGQGKTGGNIIGSTDYNSCLDSGSWAVVVVYEDAAAESKNIVMKDKLFLRASDYSWHLYGEHGRRHTKINHAPIQEGAKLYLYSMMGHEASMAVPLSPTCSCGCAGSYFLSNNSGGIRSNFYSDIAEDVITDDPVHSDRTNGPWYLHSYTGSGQKNIRGNDYTRVISGSKVALFPNLYEGKGTVSFPPRYAGDGIATYENENQWKTDGESYRGHDWSGQGLITYHAADNSISLLEMELDPSKISVGQTETWVSIKANQKQVFKPMDRIALRFIMFETPAILGPQFNNVQASGNGQRITVSGNVVKEGGDITGLTVIFNGTNVISGNVSFGPYEVTVDGSGNFSYTSPSLDLNYHYVATLTAADNDGESSSVNAESIEIGNAPDAPVINNATATGSDQRVTFSGTASDADGNLANVKVSISSDSGTWETVSVDGGGNWSYTFTGQPYAILTVIAKAVDTTGLESEVSTHQITLQPPYQTEESNLSTHVSSGRIANYDIGYGACDASYLRLFNQYGVSTIFPLYGRNGTWCVDPANLP